MALWLYLRQAAQADGSRIDPRRGTEDGCDKRDLIFAQAAFYAGALATLKVRNHLLEHGDEDAVRKTIQRQGRQIQKIQARRPRARRH
jgi:hypothetical protein